VKPIYLIMITKDLTSLVHKYVQLITRLLPTWSVLLRQATAIKNLVVVASLHSVSFVVHSPAWWYMKLGFTYKFCLFLSFHTELYRYNNWIGLWK
jgi:hypothetical protein